MADIGTAGKVGIGGLVLAILTLLTAVVNHNTGLINNLISMITNPSAQFEKGFPALEQLAERGNVKDLPTIRDRATDEYTVANTIFGASARTTDKCAVIRLFSERQDIIMALGLPDDAYSDYERRAFADSCHSSVEAAAGQELYEILSAEKNPMPAGVAQLLGSLEPPGRTSDVYQVVSQATVPGHSGWIPVGVKAARNGDYLTKETAQVPETAHPITISSASDGLPVHNFAQDKPWAGIVGFLANGSTATVLALTPFPQDGSKRYDVWAKVQFVAPKPLGAVGVAHATTHLQLARRVVAAVTPDPPGCPASPQHNSRHGSDQLWVFVGEKADNDKTDSFVPGTSRVNTPCIPRDGQTVRATQQLLVFSGPDPYYPGVHPQGGIVIAGAQFRVVGDVSGYPFDATANPGFCSGNPPPHKTKVLPVIPPGHEKRYCVYLPISPA